MNSSNLFKRADNNGYIIIPRRLVDTLFIETGIKGTPYTPVSAYLYLLMKANYTDSKDPDGLRRGELFFSGRELRTVFHWEHRTIKKFLEYLQNEGIIRITPTSDPKKSIMRLMYYDNLCRFTSRTPGGVVRTKKADEEFICFWDAYHAMTGKPEVDIELARTHWNRLNAQERRMAIENMTAYVCMQPLERLRTAANYLANKSFILF